MSKAADVTSICTVLRGREGVPEAPIPGSACGIFVRTSTSVCTTVVPLSLEGDTFTCGWHGSTFEARTGKALSGPVRPDARLIMLPTRVEDDVLTYVYEE